MTRGHDSRAAAQAGVHSQRVARYLFSSGLEARVDTASRRFKFTRQNRVYPSCLPEDFLEDQAQLHPSSGAPPRHAARQAPRSVGKCKGLLEDPQLERRAYRDMGIAASKHSHAERETAAKPLTAHMPFIIDVEYCGA